MSFTVNTHSLSGLSPVKFTYKYNSEEQLHGTYNSYRGNFGYYNYELFRNYKDAALSRRNCLVLTDVKDLQNVFKTSSTMLNVGIISGSMYLKTPEGKYLTTKDGKIYVGGTGEKLLVSLSPISNNLVELRVDKSKFVQFSDFYPYDVELNEAILDEVNSYVRRFYVEFAKNQITLRASTKEGFRYLSYSADRKVRAVGVELNDTIVNSYRFHAEPVSDLTMNYNFDPTTTEIKYFNEYLGQKTKNTVDIKLSEIKNTNLLVSCSTKDVASSNEVNLNIALTKTNFSSTGTYSSDI